MNTFSVLLLLLLSDMRQIQKFKLRCFVSLKTTVCFNDNTLSTPHDIPVARPLLNSLTIKLSNQCQQNNPPRSFLVVFPSPLPRTSSNTNPTPSNSAPSLITPYCRFDQFLIIGNLGIITSSMWLYQYHWYQSEANNLPRLSYNNHKFFFMYMLTLSASGDISLLLVFDSQTSRDWVNFEQTTFHVILKKWITITRVSVWIICEWVINKMPIMLLSW